MSSKQNLLFGTAAIIAILAFGITFVKSPSPSGDISHLFNRTEVLVNTTTKSSQKDPAVGISQDGSHVIAWASKTSDQGHYDVYGQAFDATGQPVGTEFKINSTTDGHQKNLWLDMNPSGRYVVVWDSWPLDGSDFDVMAQVFDRNNQRFGPEFKVNTTTFGYQWNGKVMMNEDNSFTILWMSNRSIGWNIIGQRFTSQATKQGPEFVVAQNILTGIGNVPNVAAEKDVEYASESVWFAADNTPIGHLAIIWMNDSDNTGFDIFGRLFSNNGTPKTEIIPVSQDLAGEQQEVAVSVNSSGQFLAAWMSDPPGTPNNPALVVDPTNPDGATDRDADVFARRFDSSGNPLENEWQVNQVELDKQGYPAVALHDDGRFVIAWESDFQDGDRSGLFSQRFSAGRQRQASEISLNSITRGWQEELSIALNQAGQFIIAWMSFDDLDPNNNFNDIYSRIFEL